MTKPYRFRAGLAADSVTTRVPVLPVGVPVLVAGILAALTTAVPSLLFADQVVYFVNGKAMMVKSVEKGPKFCVLELDGGGKVGVPTEQIDRIEEYQVQPQGVALPQPAPAIPAPAMIAPPIVPAAAPGAPPPAAQLPAALTQGAVSAPPSAPLPSGPGFGGRVDLSPQANLGSLNPLSIGGGDRSAPAPVRPMATQGMRMGGPGGGFGANRLQNQGGPGRPGFPPAGAAGRFGGKGGMGARQRMGGMTAEQAPAPQQAAPQSAPQPQSAQPAATPPPPPPPEESETPPDPPPASTSDDGSSSGDEAPADQGSS